MDWIVMPCRGVDRWRASCFRQQRETLHRPAELKLCLVWDDLPDAVPEEVTDWSHHPGRVLLTHGHIQENYYLRQCISWHSSAVRSLGFYWAWKHGARNILTLDSDCDPGKIALWHAHHAANLEARLSWHRFTRTVAQRSRGLPYRQEEEVPCGISHGLWTQVGDWSAVDQLVLEGDEESLEMNKLEQTIQPGHLFPMCGMNLAFRAQLAPLMWFGWQGRRQGPIDRFDDIWAGYVAKWWCDHVRWSVYSGQPYVKHERASHALSNLHKEVSGLWWNEYIWEQVLRQPFCPGEPMLNQLRRVWRAVGDLFGRSDLQEAAPAGHDWPAYGRALSGAAGAWLDLFAEEGRDGQKVDSISR